MYEKNAQVYMYPAFLIIGHAFWKEKIEDRVKLLGQNAINRCLKITMADLCKIVPKMRK